nr:ATP-binding protein [Planctomycetota bacterium]
TLSYLAGPMTRPQIARLRAASGKPGAAAPVAATISASSASAATSSARPQLPPGIPQCVLPAQTVGAAVSYRPAILGAARIVFTAGVTGDDVVQDICLVASIGALGPDWDSAREIATSIDTLLATSPQPGAAWGELPPAAAQVKSYTLWKRELTDQLARTRTLTAWRNTALRMTSQLGESEEAFRGRLALSVRESRDAETEKLRARYTPKLSALQERIRRAEQAKERESQQAGDARLQAVIGFGTTLLGAFLGRKAFSSSTISKAGTAARGAGRALREGQDVGRAEETVAALQSQLANLDAEFQSAIAALERAQPEAEAITLRPKRGAVDVRLIGLAWIPEVF